MEVKVITGCSYGDEGKGLVSGCLAREAASRGHRILTVFYNGTNQRAHTFEGTIRQFTAAGEDYGSDTFYHRQFVIDPIMLWLHKVTPIIDPRCRVIFPCDVLHGQAREKVLKHGSCGYGLFAAVKRAAEVNFTVNELFLSANMFYPLVQRVDSYYDYEPNEIHNMRNFLLAVKWIKENCRFITFEDLMAKDEYNTIIYEGGQGLLLDQANKGDFPHLTPSSTGAFNIHEDIEKLGVRADLFYVNRTYMTRHGRGPLDMECGKEEIDKALVDSTNQPNDWQGSLRFGRVDVDKLYKRVQGDAVQYNCDKTVNMVFTHLNYTNDQLFSTNGLIEIARLDFIDNLYTSDKKDFMIKN